MDKTKIALKKPLVFTQKIKNFSQIPEDPVFKTTDKSRRSRYFEFFPYFCILNTGVKNSEN
jgi:hypothetical protein